MLLKRFFVTYIISRSVSRKILVTYITSRSVIGKIMVTYMRSRSVIRKILVTYMISRSIIRRIVVTYMRSRSVIRKILTGHCLPGGVHMALKVTISGQFNIKPAHNCSNPLPLFQLFQRIYKGQK